MAENGRSGGTIFTAKAHNWHMTSGLRVLLSIVVAAMFLWPVLLIGQEADSVELAFIGDFLGSHAFPETGQGWFAVSQTPTGMTLTETRIEVSKVPHPCSGATLITAVDVDEPLFLVRGLSSFQSGPLDSVFEERRFIYPAEEISLRLGSGAYFGFKAYGSATPETGDIRVTDYEIRMHRGTRTQTIAEDPWTTGGGPLQLVWAGDLDRDGGPDVLLHLPMGDYGTHFVLFLASAASSNQLVGRVAEFHAGAC